MTETAYLVRNVSHVPLRVYDGTDLTDKPFAVGMMSVLNRMAAAGMLWRSAGAPTYSAAMRAGSFIIDTTNHDLYIADGGACNKVTAS
jgi:hypothetical protein